ncbi:hypothetical protein BBJ28_00015616 [Nothophytophthora sp. Chile5]|nr:hypothetical protein BBJ28_00015616 [Nothophytophthora sp. Chile5]
MQHVFPPQAHDVFRNVPLVYTREIDQACEKIRNATDGLGVDEKVLVRELSSLSARNWALIIYRYKDLYREELKDTLSRETVGDFRFLLLLLTMPLPEAEAFLLDVATTGSGTTERLLYPVRYARLQVAYNPKIHTKEKAEADADLLYKAGEGRWGTDETAFVKLLFSSPREHLVRMNKIYEYKYISDLEGAVQNEFSGYASESLVFYGACVSTGKLLLSAQALR